MVEIVGQTLPKFGEAHNYLTFNSKYIFTDLEVVELTERTKMSFQFYCDSGGADLSRSLKMQFQIFWETQGKSLYRKFYCQ